MKTPINTTAIAASKTGNVVVRFTDHTGKAKIRGQFSGYGAAAAWMERQGAELRGAYFMLTIDGQELLADVWDGDYRLHPADVLRAIYPRWFGPENTSHISSARCRLVLESLRGARPTIYTGVA